MDGDLEARKSMPWKDLLDVCPADVKRMSMDASRKIAKIFADAADLLPEEEEPEESCYGC